MANIFITGTSRGIGLYLAQYYTEQGHNVLGCSRSQSSYTHKNYTHFCLDITKEEEVLALSSKIKKEDFKKIDVLIHNAGIASMNHFLFTSLEKARKVMDTNFFAPFILSRALISLLKKSSHPRIIHFSTVAVPFNLEGELIYVASKAAVESMTKILAKELAHFKITVNAVAPSPVQTALISGVSEEKITNLLERQAIKRYSTFEDIENVLSFFMQEKSDFITGQIIYLGGVNT